MNLTLRRCSEANRENLYLKWTRRPGQQVAIGSRVYEHACKPGADVQAVGYRAAVLSMLIHLALHPENPIKELGPWLKEDQLEAVVFTAAAKVTMEWMGVGIFRDGPPVDLDEFLRLCGR